MKRIISIYLCLVLFACAPAARREDEEGVGGVAQGEPRVRRAAAGEAAVVRLEDLAGGGRRRRDDGDERA